MADYVQRQHRAQRQRTGRPLIEAAQTPFRNDTLMVGPPSCTAENFETPRPHRCPFGRETLAWKARRAGGLDGYVRNVRFGVQGPFAPKVSLDCFWLAGFSRTRPLLKKNWNSSVLVDLSDIVQPRGYSWKQSVYGPPVPWPDFREHRKATKFRVPMIEPAADDCAFKFELGV
ncbi:hypothetical protein VTI74DRAFT_4342 [Chaetomium olivicolor]